MKCQIKRCADSNNFIYKVVQHRCSGENELSSANKFVLFSFIDYLFASMNKHDNYDKLIKYIL